MSALVDYPDHVVQPGENLAVIARRYPEQAITADSLAAANFDRYPSLATDRTAIQVGWTLRIG
jgi:hypothetical protein